MKSPNRIRTAVRKSRKSILETAIILAAVPAVSMLPKTAGAASYTWTNGGGTMTWDTSAANWTLGSGNTAWVTSNDADFGATGIGSVAIGFAP